MNGAEHKDKTIELIIKQIVEQIKKEHLRPDGDNYFTNKALDDLRNVYEKYERRTKNGYDVAKTYVAGKMRSKDNRKNKILLYLLEALESVDNLDISTKAYVIGKLNSILTVYNLK